MLPHFFYILVNIHNYFNDYIMSLMLICDLMSATNFGNYFDILAFISKF